MTIIRTSDGPGPTVEDSLVTELMSTEGLSSDATVVLPMTERPTTSSGESIDATLSADWQA